MARAWSVVPSVGPLVVVGLAKCAMLAREPCGLCGTMVCMACALVGRPPAGAPVIGSAKATTEELTLGAGDTPAIELS